MGKLANEQMMLDRILSRALAMKMTAMQHVASVSFSGDRKAKKAYEKLIDTLTED